MRIALVAHDVHQAGGHGIYTHWLAEVLSNRCEVSVFASMCERPTDAAWAHRCVRSVRQGSLSAVVTFPWGLGWHARELAEFDIVHAQGYCGGRPNVITAHICVGAYRRSLHRPRAKTVASLGAMERLERAYYARHEGMVISPSHKTARDLRDLYGYRGPIRVVPHGVDTLRFNSTNRSKFRHEVRTQLGVEPERTIALYVGDLAKAHAHLRRLAELVPSLQLVCVTRSRDYRFDQPNVKFAPPTKQIERYFAAADVFVFPTTYDSFGMVATEAMASGLPVISSDQAGAAELIEHGVTGWCHSLERWAEATAEQLEEPDALRAAGGAAERRMQTNTWQDVAAQVEAIYADLPRRQRRRRS